MNTMIPNKARFDLNLQDLPARATEVDRESVMKVSGGGCLRYFKCFRTDGVGFGQPVTSVKVTWNGCRDEDGTWACNQQSACRSGRKKIGVCSGS
jgi:hypothetical protein